jgi:hypothetical protein
MHATGKHLAGAVRGHWGIENRLHQVRDVTWDEGLQRCRSSEKIQLERDETASAALSRAMDEVKSGALPSYIFRAIVRQTLMDSPRVALPLLMAFDKGM